MAKARVFSDGGSMTVGRRTSNYTWGQFEVVLPDGEQQEQTDDRIVDAYVYRPDDAGTGRAELTFVRADARIDMNAGRSDLEATLDSASRRTEGDVFYTREISGLGLAGTTPGVDYVEGDVVEVVVWSQLMDLPVTAMRARSSPEDPDGEAIQVGGQVLRDPAAMRKRNHALDAQIAAEKRQRLRQVGEVDRKAEGAQKSAEGAQKSTDGLTEDLTGDVETPVPEAVEQRLGALGGIQRSVDQAQNEQLILHDNQLKWLRWTQVRFNFGFSTASGEAYNVTDEIETGLVDVIVNEVSNRGVRWIVRPGWRGTYRIEARFTDETESTIHGRSVGQAAAFSTQTEMEKTVSRASVQVWPDHGVEPREWAVQVQRNQGAQPQFIAPGGLGADEITLTDEGRISFSVPVRADHTVRHLGVLPLESGQLITQNTEVAPNTGETSGVVVFTEVMPQLQWDVGLPLRGSQTMQIPSQTVPRSSSLTGFVWAEVGRWVAPEWDSPVRGTIRYSIRWSSYDAWNLHRYTTRIRVNGRTEASIERSTVGGMNSLFGQSVTLTLRPGDVVTIGAAARASESHSRMSGDFTVSWQPL